MSNENKLFEAIKEVASTIEFFLCRRKKEESLNPEEALRSKWSILKANIDPDTIKSFLQAGISYSQTEGALALGMEKLDRYRDVFSGLDTPLRSILRLIRKPS